MEFNRTTKNVDITTKTEQGLLVLEGLISPHMIKLKLFKDKNNFFTKYEEVNLLEEKNIIPLPITYKRNNWVASININLQDKTVLRLIILTDGRIIDTRRIKLKEYEHIEVLTYDEKIEIKKIHKASGELTKLITIELD